MDTSAAQAGWFMLAALPISVWVAWSDMKFMRIPNVAVLALVAGFAVLGLLALPLGEYLWRYAHLAVILLVGFLMSSANLIGAGDAKFAAAMAPFIARGDIGFFCFVFAAVLLASFAAHRLFRRISAVRQATPDWQSWTETKKFPMGLALGGALIAYLVLALIQ